MSMFCLDLDSEARRKQSQDTFGEIRCGLDRNTSVSGYVSTDKEESVYVCVKKFKKNRKKLCWHNKVLTCVSFGLELQAFRIK